jgi:hypothetical protein
VEEYLNNTPKKLEVVTLLSKTVPSEVYVVPPAKSLSNCQFPESSLVTLILTFVKFFGAQRY